MPATIVTQQGCRHRCTCAYVSPDRQSTPGRGLAKECVPVTDQLNVLGAKLRCHRQAHSIAFRGLPSNLSRFRRVRLLHRSVGVFWGIGRFLDGRRQRFRRRAQCHLVSCKIHVLEMRFRLVTIVRARNRRKCPKKGAHRLTVFCSSWLIASNRILLIGNGLNPGEAIFDIDAFPNPSGRPAQNRAARSHLQQQN